MCFWIMPLGDNVRSLLVNVDIAESFLAHSDMQLRKYFLCLVHSFPPAVVCWKWVQSTLIWNANVMRYHFI